jgi:hypothetical protein
MFTSLPAADASTSTLASGAACSSPFRACPIASTKHGIDALRASAHVASSVPISSVLAARWRRLPAHCRRKSSCILAASIATVVSTSSREAVATRAATRRRSSSERSTPSGLAESASSCTIRRGAAMPRCPRPVLLTATSAAAAAVAARGGGGGGSHMRSASGAALRFLVVARKVARCEMAWCHASPERRNPWKESRSTLISAEFRYCAEVAPERVGAGRAPAR